MFLCGASGKSVGASCRGQPGRVSRVAVRTIPVFHSDSVPTGRDFAASSKPPRPGVWSFERLISDSFLFSRLAARSRVPPCVTDYDLASRAASLHASPRGLPPTTCAAVAPPRRAWPRASTNTTQPIHHQHRATVPRALHRASMKIKRPKAAENKKPCPSLTRPAPSLGSPHPSRFGS